MKGNEGEVCELGGETARSCRPICGVSLQTEQMNYGAPE
jgi:hypothetical protein